MNEYSTKLKRYRSAHLKIPHIQSNLMLCTKSTPGAQKQGQYIPKKKGPST